MIEVRQPTLLGRVIVKGNIEAETGLHIGGTEAGIGIGGVDKIVVRNALNQQPYIPGSSLKGKLRSLLERALGLAQNHRTKGKDNDNRMSQIFMHCCQKQFEYDQCPVCRLFGVPSNWDDKNGSPYPTRIIVRDGRLQNHEAIRAATELPYTEAKTEVSIDRLTSAANPRTFERVPAGALFDLEITVNFYTTDDFSLMDTLLFGLGLVQGDYLGGQGSRGYGKVGFYNLRTELQSFNGNELNLPAWVNALAEKGQDLSNLPWHEYPQRRKD